MFKPKLLLAAGALLGLAGCVADDGYYGSGYGYDGYSGSGYPSYSGGYPYYDPNYGYSRSGSVYCQLDGAKDVYTSPDDCRRRQRYVDRRDDDRDDRRDWNDRRREEARDEWQDRRKDWERDRERAERERERDRERAERERDRDRDRDRDEWRRRASRYEQPGASSPRCPAPLSVGPRGTCVGQTE